MTKIGAVDAEIAESLQEVGRTSNAKLAGPPLDERYAPPATGAGRGEGGVTEVYQGPLNCRNIGVRAAMAFVRLRCCDLNASRCCRRP